MITPAVVLALATVVAAEQPWQAVVFFVDGSVEQRSLTLPLEEAQVARIDFAWVWNQSRPPRRLRGREMLEAIGESDSPVTSANVVVSGLPKRSAQESTRLVAAPADMWGEVPEPLLPTFVLAGEASFQFPCDEERAFRVRALAADMSSSWTDVRKCRTDPLTLRDAADLHTVITPAGGARVLLLQGTGAFAIPQTLALFKAEKAGEVTIPLAPPFRDGVIVVAARDSVARALRIDLRSLPRSVELQPGARLTGRVVSEEGVPISDAVVRGEWWDESGSIGHRVTHTSDNGRWVLTGVPRTAVMLVINSSGSAPLKRRIEVTAERIDIDDLILRPPVSVRLDIVDRDDKPIPDATIFAAGETTRTDAEGVALLEGLAPDAELKVGVEASGFEKEVLQIFPPIPERRTVRLRASFRIRGRFIDKSGQAPPGVMLKIRADSRELSREVRNDGSFDLDLKPEVPIELTFLSSVTQELRVPVRAGRPGEVRDLGDLTPPEGIAVHGRVLDGRDRSPVGDARVWALRPSMTPNLALARREIFETRTNAEGHFRLSGLDAASSVIRIDGEGYARLYLDVTPQPPPAPNDLGDISVFPGAMVQINAGRGNLVRADLKGEGLDADVITASIVSGAAMLRHVPPGVIRVEILSDNDVICETTLTVDAEDDRIEGRCDDRPRIVRGEVSVAGRAGEGLLMWERRSSRDEVILSRGSPAGVQRQQVFGMSASSRAAIVDAGKFETSGLMAGTWQVTWMPHTGGRAVPREVLIDERDEQFVSLRYEGGAIHGVVLDRNSLPVERASVFVEGMEGGALSGADGTFSLVGMAPGEHRVRARERHRASDAVVVRVEEGRSGAPVRLVLDRDARRSFVVAIRTAAGPAAGATVFLDIGTAVTFGTADIQGVASFEVPLDIAGEVRAAALHQGQWAFGNFTRGESLELALSETGSFIIESASEDQELQILSPGGWDVSALLKKLGAAPRAGVGRSFLMNGMPTGIYTVRQALSSQIVRVERDQIVKVVFR